MVENETVIAEELDRVQPPWGENPALLTSNSACPVAGRVLLIRLESSPFSQSSLNRGKAAVNVGFQRTAELMCRGRAQQCAVTAPEGLVFVAPCEVSETFAVDFVRSGIGPQMMSRSRCSTTACRIVFTIFFASWFSCVQTQGTSVLQSWGVTAARADLALIWLAWVAAQ